MNKIKYKVVGDGYQTTEEYKYYSKRYNRTVTVPIGFFSDGATLAPDISSLAWWVHDVFCRYGAWDDGTKITNWDASAVLGDILWSEGYKLRAYTWRWMTYFFGGGAARKNGDGLYDDVNG